MTPINPEHVREFNKLLFCWHERNRRDFSWRQNNDIYSVLTAEILLQKTNAAKVGEVHRKLLTLYRTPEDLVAADTDDLIELIRPLGLITKASTLKAAATMLLTKSTESIAFDDLIRITGVGNYIAHATLIHVQGQRLSLIDPNFVRVYERVFGIYSRRSRPRTDSNLWEIAKDLLPGEGLSHYVYAILDFGHAVCKLTKPLCDSCPMFNQVCSGPNRSDRVKSSRSVKLSARAIT